MNWHWVVFEDGKVWLDGVEKKNPNIKAKIIDAVKAKLGNVEEAKGFFTEEDGNITFEPDTNDLISSYTRFSF